MKTLRQSLIDYDMAQLQAIAGCHGLPLETAKRIEAAGVAMTHMRFDGMLHGFVHFSSLFEDGRQALKDIGEFLKH